MKCFDREQLFACVHRLLEPREEREVGAHAEQCSDCRTVLEDYERLDAVLQEWKPTEPSPWFDVRVRQALRSAEAEPPPSGWFGLRWARWLAPALVGILVIVASVVIPRMRRAPVVPSSGSSQEQSKVAQTAPAEAKAQPAVLAERDELGVGKSLPVLEDYDMLADFDVLSELSKGRKQVVN